MFRHLIANVLVGMVATSLAFAQPNDDTKQQSPRTPKITGEYLLTHGFERSPKAPDIYERAHVRLGDVARELGFSPKSLEHTLNGSAFDDTRTVDVGELTFVVRAEFRDKNGKVSFRSIPQSGDNDVLHALDDPNAMCTISVSLKQLLAREFLKTDSTPQLRIVSVTVSKRRPKSLQVEFELSASGTKPVAIDQNEFHVRLAGGKLPPGWYFDSSFPEGTPRTIVVSPDKPEVLALSVPLGQKYRMTKREYSMQVEIRPFKGRGSQSYDYEWEGRGHHSEEFTFIGE